MGKQNTIPKQAPSRETLNYKTLIAIGQAYIENVAGKIWTDYNVHDPGVTTLELLAYAITDLGYRINLPIQDLLARKDQKEGGLTSHFFTAKQILPTCPINENDYRKIFIDIEGVNNAWVRLSTKPLWIDCTKKYTENEDNYGVLQLEVPESEKSKSFEVKGFYTILLELDSDITDPDEIQTILDSAKRKYHDNRNLCEDLLEIKVVPKQKVAFCASVELEPNASAAEVWANIVFTLENYLHPPVRFYSLPQMLDRKDENGKPLAVDQIFEGPVLDHGFIPDDELIRSKLRKEVRASDIIRIVMDISGVRKINDILIDFCGMENPNTGGKWLLCIPDDHLPVLCPEKTIINFNKNELPITYDKTVVRQKLASLRQAQMEANKNYTYGDLSIPGGTYTEVKDYYTIQNEFPNNYGINQNGLPSTASTERKALAKQFKGYLVVFDQMLSFYMKHLSEVRQLFEADDSIRKSYFSQEINGIKDIESLFADYSTLETAVETIVAGLDNYHERKNKFLDHLIARFAERFNEYTFLLRDLFTENLEDAIISHKVHFLKDYPELSRCRAKSYNYLFPKDNETWNTVNVPGLQKRIARLTGMRSYERHDLSGVLYEIYQEKDDDGIDEYRWRIRDKNSKIILSSSTRYLSKQSAVDEKWVTVSLAWSRANYEIKETKNGKFYFNVIDKVGEVVGRRIEYYSSMEKTEEAIAHIIDFMYNKMADEGMYIFEHILLLPDQDPGLGQEHFLPVCLDKNCEGCDPIDPYSFRITVVLPGWTNRFGNIDFRKFMEKTIRMECPAHILPKICWISQDQMTEIEIVYKNWLEANIDGKNKTIRNAALKALLEVLLHLHTVYPEGKLYDCKDPEEEDNPIILNRTNLGNL